MPETSERTSKAPTESEVEMTQLVMPQDANNWGTAFGGKILAWIDIAAAIAAGRHAEGPVVTAAMDDVHFIRPINRGDVVCLKARVNYVGRTSMEVGVRVEGETWGGLTYHALTAYVTFVAIDRSTSSPRPVEGLALSTDEERRRHKDARERMERRRARRELRMGRLEDVTDST
ncbi:MAG: hotdog domain-containing protein [Myxococcota bacterium]|nr:hotdog domain-containing protein [Myxococcota bacterium]